MEPQQCCGITSRGQRCKKMSSGMSRCYRIDLPTCRYHKTKNWFYQWSLYHYKDDVPENIKRYLENFYNIQKINPYTNHLTCVMMTTQAWPTIDTSNFFTSLFELPECTGECPICMETTYLQYPLKRCHHSFCFGCISNWIRETPNCPMCRKNVFKL